MTIDLAGARSSVKLVLFVFANFVQIVAAVIWTHLYGELDILYYIQWT